MHKDGQGDYVMSFRRGLRGGIPIALGYLPVSFGFGLTAVNMGLDPIFAILISLTNLTSAGQLAGLSLLAGGGSLPELILTELTINLRYSLMSLSLSQKKQSGFTLPRRLLCAFGITDEIFAVASAESGSLTPRYMAGLILLPYLGWASGTTLGALAGNILPAAVCDALGIAIYGMFVAIVIPEAKRSRGVLFATLAAVGISLTLAYLPLFSLLGSGFALILAALIASALAAWRFPINEEA